MYVAQKKINPLKVLYDFILKKLEDAHIASKKNKLDSPHDSKRIVQLLTYKEKHGWHNLAYLRGPIRKNGHIELTYNKAKHAKQNILTSQLSLR